MYIYCPWVRLSLAYPRLKYYVPREGVACAYLQHINLLSSKCVRRIERWWGQNSVQALELNLLSVARGRFGSRRPWEALVHFPIRSCMRKGRVGEWGRGKLEGGWVWLRERCFLLYFGCYHMRLAMWDVGRIDETETKVDCSQNEP